MSKSADFGGNAILGCLKGKEKTLAFQGGEIVDFKVHQSVYRPEERITEAYFPLGDIFSVVARMKDGGKIEIWNNWPGEYYRSPACHGQRHKRQRKLLSGPGKSLENACCDVSQLNCS